MWYQIKPGNSRLAVHGLSTEKGGSQKVNKLFKVATKNKGGRTLSVIDLQPIHLQSIGDITIRHCNKSFFKTYVFQTQDNGNMEVWSGSV